jgi:hypothetical protein
MTFVIWALPDSVLEFTMGRRVMKKTIIAVVLILMVALLIGCTKRSNQSVKQSEVADSSQTTGITSGNPFVALVPVSQRRADSKATAMAEDIGFLNQHFVVSDNSMGKFEPTRFRADGNQIAFEYDNTDPGKPKTHGIESASAFDLNPDSVRTLAGWLAADCKDQKNCVLGSDSRPKNTMNVGAFAQASVEEASQHLKRILLLQQGKAAPEVQPEATEEEIAEYLTANVRKTARLGPFAAFNRVVIIEGDDLIEDQEVIETDTGERGHLTIKIRLSEASMAVSTGADVGIACDLAPGGDGLADCVSDAAGDHSNNIEIKNVRNAPEVVKMLNRLFLLHKREESASATQ